MDRKTLGAKIGENLAIQGELESAKSTLKQLVDQKIDADKVVAAGVEAKKASDKLAVAIKDADSNVKTLEGELSDSDTWLSSNNAKVPRIIDEVKASPSHIRL